VDGTLLTARTALPGDLLVVVAGTLIVVEKLTRVSFSAAYTLAHIARLLGIP
jgi:hypothetical protein